MTDLRPTPSLAVLTALAEPNRLAIVSLLRKGPRAVGEIASQVKIAQPHASRHLRILADAGLVSARREAQSRIYRLERAPFASLEEWLDTFAVVWEERADRLGDYLERLDEGSTDSSRRGGTR
jgi:DNA-binding transcriptional ArsR family regulator